MIEKNIKITNNELTVEPVAALCVHATNARFNEEMDFMWLVPHSRANHKSRAHSMGYITRWRYIV